MGSSVALTQTQPLVPCSDITTPHCAMEPDSHLDGEAIAVRSPLDITIPIIRQTFVVSFRFWEESLHYGGPPKNAVPP